MTLLRMHVQGMFQHSPVQLCLVLEIRRNSRSLLFVNTIKSLQELILFIIRAFVFSAVSNIIKFINSSIVFPHCCYYIYIPYLLFICIVMSVSEKHEVIKFT